MDTLATLIVTKRGLPKLMSAQAAPTTSTVAETEVDNDSNSETSTGTILSTASTTTASSTMASVTTSDSSDKNSFSTTGSSSSSMIATPSITPPSASGNPHIMQLDHRPEGTVFIAVGAIAGSIFAAIFIWWTVTSYISRRNARLANYDNIDYQYASRDFSDNTYDGGSSNNNPFNDDKYQFPLNNMKSNNQNINANNTKRNSHVGLFTDPEKSCDDGEWYQNDLNSITDINEFNTPTKFNPIHDSVPNYNRRSLFISPTLEVVQQQRKNRQSRLFEPQNQSLMSLESHDDNNLNMPERAASPERKKKVREGYHRRNQSSLGLIASPTKSNVNLTLNDDSDNYAIDENPDSYNMGTPVKSKHKQTPSMYLEDLLRE